MVNSKYHKWFTNKTILKLDIHGFRRVKKSSLERYPKRRFQEIFCRIDSDRDGRISCDELRSFFRWTGDHVLCEEATIVVDDLDVDIDGLIDYHGFVQLVDGGRQRGRREGEKYYEDDIRRAFEVFEGEEREGFITPKGLQRVFEKLGEEKTHDECSAMIRVYDLDGNGVLDYHEFYRMMC